MMHLEPSRQVEMQTDLLYVQKVQEPRVSYLEWWTGERLSTGKLKQPPNLP